MALSSRKTLRNSPARGLMLGLAVRMAVVPLALSGTWAWNATALGQTAPAGGVGAGAVPGGGNVVLEGLPILKVEVVGNTRTPAEVILDQVRAQAGQAYSRALLDVDVKAVSALDKFVTVQAQVIPVENPQNHTLRGVNIQFVVEERAIVNAVEIVGNRKFYDNQIREGLLTRAGVAVDPFRIETDKRYILNLYHQKGYISVAVTVDPKLLKDKGIVRYEIVEGPKAVVTKIEFQGNDNISDAYIRWRIQTKTKFWVFRPGLLDDEKLLQDVVAIREMYIKRGFIDAKVSYSLDYSEDKTELAVRFAIIEGPHYRIGKITVTGNTTFATFELLGNAGRIKPGDFAERDRIDALQKQIEDAYGHQGYINRLVEVSTAYTTEPGVVDLNINISEGPAYRIGRIIIRGNSEIQDKVIRRQLRVYPDQTFDLVQIQKSIEHLKSTTLFNGDAKITPITARGNPAGIKDMLVEVAPGQTGKFSAGVGISTESGAVGQFSLEQKNFDITNPPRSWDEFLTGKAFKGAGQYFRILLEPGTEFQRYRLTFEEPFLFDTSYSFANDLYYFTRARESWDERRIGDIVTLGKRFGDVWATSLAFRAEQVGIRNPTDLFSDRITQSDFVVTNPDGTTTTFNDTTQEVLNGEGNHFLTSIKPSIARDTTDSRIFPTTGTIAGLSVEQYGAMGGDVTMTKIQLNFNAYYTLYTDLFDRKTVLTLKNQVGFIPAGDSVFYERFYLGGLGDLRGFKFRGVSPRTGPLKDPVGGDFDWASTAEVNFPVYEDFLRGVVFTDVGTVEKDIEISTVRSDIGAGVRLNLPIFGGLPLALDFAYPVTKASFDKTQYISISIGASF